MTDIEFAALMVSRVCHDLVGPLGAVVNGMEVLEDERDPAMRADAIKLVTMSADQALARADVVVARSASGDVVQLPVQPPPWLQELLGGFAS